MRVLFYISRVSVPRLLNNFGGSMKSVKRFVGVRVGADTLSVLDGEAVRRGVLRSAVLRQVLEAGAASIQNRATRSVPPQPEMDDALAAAVAELDAFVARPTN